MKKIIQITFLLCTISSLLMAKSTKEDFKLQKNSFKLKKGGSATFNIDVSIPQGMNIYLKRPKGSVNVITEISLEKTAGLALEVNKRPVGTQDSENHLIVAGKGRNKVAGSYQVTLFETSGKAGSKISKANIVIKTQMCETAKKTCFKPETFKYAISVEVLPEIKSRAKARIAHAMVSATGNDYWVASYDKALKQAKEKNQNIFVLITAPSWCGYCRVLERNVFSKTTVQKTLESKIVSLQVLDTSKDLSKFQVTGYPTMYVYNASGKKIGDIYQNTEKGFLNEIKPFLKVGSSDDGELNEEEELEEEKEITFSQPATEPLAPKKNSVLVGFQVRAGEIVDAVAPIYALVNNGKLGKTYKGKLVGGTGGSETEYIKKGHVVVGFSLRRGTWFDKKGVDKLVIKWMPWAAGKTKGDIVTSEAIADFNKLLDIPGDYPETFDYQAPEGHFVIGMNIVAEERDFGDIYLSNMKPVYGSKPSLKDGPEDDGKNENELKKSTTSDTNYQFQIKVVSGSKQNLEASGSFSFDSSVLSGEGVEFVEVFEFNLNYGDKEYNADNLDWRPKVRFQDGKFTDVFFVGGPQNDRFGANVGFSRSQFGRPSESFVRDGKSYFAYLDAYTYVDGVGTIEYIQD